MIDKIERMRSAEQDSYETEKHVHNHEKWFGVAAAPAGETNIADRIGPAIAAFALLSGNDLYGNWVQILGSADTPVAAGMTMFDPHRIQVTTTDSTAQFVIQVVSGESAGRAAKIAAEDFNEVPYIAATNNADSGIAEVIALRCLSGVKLWARCICIGANAKTINFYFGIHEYIR